jgi:hypothetical protein
MGTQKSHRSPLGILSEKFDHEYWWVNHVVIVVFLVFAFIWIVFSGRSQAILSPFASIEKKAALFGTSIGVGKISGAIGGNSDEMYFSKTNGSAMSERGINYTNRIYQESIIYLPSKVPDEAFNVKDFPWEELPDDRIIDYWIQGFKVSQEKEAFSVCYQFRSGAVLQVADLYDIYGKPADAMHPHKYRVVRMFFVGTKYKKYFPHAYFETEANIRHHKELMKYDKGWVQQANRYIDEKEVKKEKPILDYRTNPDYYKPLSERKSGKSWVSRLVE